MLWQYTRRDTKVLMVATLCTFSGYGLLCAQDWQSSLTLGSQGAQAVGVVAGVEQNKVNGYLATLDARERELAQREAELAARESSSPPAPDGVLVMVTLGGLALLGLILLNFYLDNKRRLSLA